MNTEIEELVGTTLHARADTRAPAPSLYEGAVRRGRSLRRRRYASMAGGVAAAVAVVVAGVAVVPAVLPHRPGPATGGAPPPVAPPHNAGPTTLPPAQAWPAGARPSVVGTDPGTVHFDLDLAALHATGSEWNTDDGFESAVVFTGTGHDYHYTSGVYLSPDEAVLRGHLWGGFPVAFSGGQAQPPPSPLATGPITVHGRPGTVERFGTGQPAPDGGEIGAQVVVRWQPVDGLWAGVEVGGGDPAPALAVADALRLDRVQKCVVPVRATVVPAGARWTGCTTHVSPHDGLQGVWVGSTLRFTHDGGVLYAVVQDGTRYNGVNPGDFKANATVGGRPAMWNTPTLAVPGFAGKFYLEIQLTGAGFTKDEAVAVGNGLQVGGDLAKPETWPARAVG